MHLERTASRLSGYAAIVKPSSPNRFGDSIGVSPVVVGVVVVVVVVVVVGVVVVVVVVVVYSFLASLLLS